MQHLRGRIAKSDVPRTYVRTYVGTHVRTYVPTHPALCLGTSVPRQKFCSLATKSDTQIFRGGKFSMIKSPEEFPLSNNLL